MERTSEMGPVMMQEQVDTTDDIKAISVLKLCTCSWMAYIVSAEVLFSSDENRHKVTCIHGPSRFEQSDLDITILMVCCEKSGATLAVDCAFHEFEYVIFGIIEKRCSIKF